jgi:large subunit ribosomal protein L10
MFAARYTGLSVSQMQDLRQRIVEDATFSVVKNTLARRAAEASEREDMLEHLAGPTGIVWITGDPARAAKALAEFGKESDDLFSIKGGLLNGKPFGAEQVTALTKLPSREELIAKLAGGLAAPLHGLSALSQPLNELGGGLNQLLSGLPNALDQLRAQKEAAGG